MADCNVLGEMNSAAQEILRNTASHSKLYEVEKKERRDRKKLARKSEEQKNELKATKKRIARLEGAVWETKTSQGSTPGMAVRKTARSSGGSPSSIDSSEVSNETQKEKKGG